MFLIKVISIFKLISKYLFIWKSELHRDSERQRSSIHWFNPQMATKALSGTGWIQAFRDSSDITCGNMSPSTRAIFCWFPGTLAETWVGSGAPESWTSTNMGCKHCKWWLYPLCQNASPSKVLLNKFKMLENSAGSFNAFHEVVHSLNAHTV